MGFEAVKLDHVRRVHGEVYHQITSQDIVDLPDPEKVVLLAVTRALRTRRSAYVSFEDIRKECAAASEDLGVKLENVDYAVQDLGDRGIIDIRSLTRIGIRDIPTEELIRYLDNLLERVRSGLGEHEG